MQPKVKEGAKLRKELGKDKERAKAREARDSTQLEPEWSGR